MKCKTTSAMGMSKQDTWKIRDFSTLGGSAVAEFVTGAFLGPYEKLDDETDVVNGLFLVFGLTFRLTPCNMVKISVQQRITETIYQCLVTTPSEMSFDVIQMLSLVHDCCVSDRLSRLRINSWVIFERSKKDAEQHNNYRRP